MDFKGPSVGMDALHKAVECLGGARHLAQAAGIAPATVYAWLSRRRNMSPRLAKRIEEATGGAVTRKQLLPDVFR